jgi:hypothetical protein
MRELPGGGKVCDAGCVDRIDLADLVAQIREVVAREGYRDRAEWLGERERTLRSGDPESAQTATKELSVVVHGMGGLLDIYFASAEERRRMTDLIDQLWTATKP